MKIENSFIAYSIVIVIFFKSFVSFSVYFKFKKILKSKKKNSDDSSSEN